MTQRSPLPSSIASPPSSPLILLPLFSFSSRLFQPPDLFSRALLSPLQSLPPFSLFSFFFSFQFTQSSSVISQGKTVFDSSIFATAFSFVHEVQSQPTSNFSSHLLICLLCSEQQSICHLLIKVLLLMNDSSTKEGATHGL